MSPSPLLQLPRKREGIACGLLGSCKQVQPLLTWQQRCAAPLVPQLLTWQFATSAMLLLTWQQRRGVQLVLPLLTAQQLLLAQSEMSLLTQQQDLCALLALSLVTWQQGCPAQGQGLPAAACQGLGGTPAWGGACGMRGDEW